MFEKSGGDAVGGGLAERKSQVNEIAWAVSACVGCPSAVYMQNMSAAVVRVCAPHPCTLPDICSARSKVKDSKAATAMICFTENFTAFPALIFFILL